MATLSDILETTALQQVATGFVFTEGPLWHPDGFFYFVDLRANLLYRLMLGRKPQVVRKTNGGNGTTFDLQGRLINCEGDGRRRHAHNPDGTVTTLLDRFEGKRQNRPNDVICAFGWSAVLHRPVATRAAGRAGTGDCRECIVSRRMARWWPSRRSNIRTDWRCRQTSARFTSPTRAGRKYIHAVEVDAAGTMVRRRIFADMSSDGTNGVPDGMKVDAAGRVFCTGTGGVWVFAPDGTKIGIIETPEVCANVAFGGPDLRTLLLTASTSVYTLRVKTPGLPHPWRKVRGG